MSEPLEMRLPPGFAAEAIALSIYGARHIGANNAGYDLSDSDGRLIQVKSCSLKLVDDVMTAEVKSRKKPSDGCDVVVFVSTSGATEDTPVSARFDQSRFTLSITSHLSRKDGPVRVFELESANFDRLVRRQRGDGGEGDHWRVPIDACTERFLQTGLSR